MSTEITYRDNIFDWLQSVLPRLWAGKADERPDNTVEFVWHMEPMARPAVPLIEGRLSADTRIHRDVINRPNGSGVRTNTGDREIMLYLTAIGEQAVDYLEDIRNSTQDPYYTWSLHQAGMAIVESYPIIDAHVYLDSMPETRATMDIRFRFIDTWTSTPGLIEHGELVGTIDAGDLITITVNPIVVP